MAKMKLYYAPNSPYARKVRVLLMERGTLDQVELIQVSTADPDSPLLKVNPLGKVPVLDAGADGLLQDSPLICEYLEGYTSSAAKPSGTGKVIDLADKCLAATAHGMLDAAYAVRMEKARPEAVQWQVWTDKQFGKINRTLDQFEAQTLPADASIGAIALACALPWMDFRLPEGNWLANRPNLRQWADTFGMRASMQQTRPA